MSIGPGREGRKLNEHPRKTRDYETPAERLTSQILIHRMPGSAPEQRSRIPQKRTFAQCLTLSDFKPLIIAPPRTSSGLSRALLGSVGALAFLQFCFDLIE